MVVAHFTKFDELKKANKALNHVGVKLLGVLMAKAEVKKP